MINHSNENSIMDDANSPEINKVLMGVVSSDFIKVSDHLKEASFQIRKRGFSENPIFVLSKNAIDFGAVLFQPEDFGTVFNYNACFLEEFVSRDMIGAESIDLFKEHYKDADEFCCLFVIDNEFAGFIYLPFPSD